MIQYIAHNQVNTLMYIQIAHYQVHTLFNWDRMLGGATNKLDSIWINTLFVLTTEHYIDKFKLKNSGETIYWYY